MKEFILAEDGYKLDCLVYEVEKPKAVVMVAHGMEEHHERYERFAKFLNANGYTVVTNNMRGHGANAELLGYFGEEDGEKKLVLDQLAIYNEIKNEYKDVPVVLFAHSMGTIIARNTLIEHSKLFSKVVLSGYPCYVSATPLGLALANMIKTFKGGKYKSKLLEDMSVGQFNKAVKNPKTSVDWLSYNEENVKNYVADPLCGVPFTTAAYIAMFKLIKNMHNPKLAKDINADLPLLLVSGMDDPCTGGEKGRADSIKTLNEFGFKNITHIEYEHMRHEILNEDEYLKVSQDVVDFLNK